jgi:hypothetical protein
MAHPLYPLVPAADRQSTENPATPPSQPADPATILAIIRPDLLDEAEIDVPIVPRRSAASWYLSWATFRL